MVDVEDVIYTIEDVLAEEGFSILGKIGEIYLSRDNGIVIEKDGQKFEIIVKEVF